MVAYKNMQKNIKNVTYVKNINIVAYRKYKNIIYKKNTY